MHVNGQLRAIVATRLAELDSLETVDTNGETDLRESELPAAVIQTPSDSVELATKRSKTDEPAERRIVQLVIVIVVDGESEGLDDALELIRVGVEKALGDGSLGGLAKRVEHIRAEKDIGVAEDGERWFAFQSLEYEVEIWTRRGDPETAL